MINLSTLRKNIISLMVLGGIFITSISTCYSQTNMPLVPKVNIPTSPEAALLGRFGDIPIGYYTGTANISIPLYSIKEGEVEIPITLNYHSSGIKVEDQATWVGLGWDLSPEGSIIQEVRGKSDELDQVAPCSGVTNYDKFRHRFDFVKNAFYAFLPQFGRATAPNTCLFSYPLDPPNDIYNPPYEDPYCAIDALLRGIGQPDIYSYSFGGHSGKFYVNPETHLPVLIEKNDQVFFEVQYNSIFATTLDGTIYNFGDIETAHGGIVGEYTGKTYKLSSITLLNGKSVNFRYCDNTYTEMAYSESANINNFSTTTTALSLKSDVTYHSKKTLIKITTSDAIIDFNLENREDINVETTDNLKRLKSIDITSKISNKKIKTFEFGYSYFPYYNSSSDPYVTAHLNAFGKRLKLESVKEIGYNETGIAITTKPPYFFGYDLSNIMPLKNSFAKDFWGYYNGIGNSTLLPNLDYFDYFNDIEYKAKNLTLKYPYVGSNRYTDNTKAGAYLLNKITYPTGGYTEFEYEPNSFTNQFIPDQYQESLTHKNYILESNPISINNYDKQFKIGKTTIIHFENRINNGKGNQNHLSPLTSNQMSGCSIELSKFTFVNGVPLITVIKKWDLSTVLNVDFDKNGGVVWQDDIPVPFDPDPNPYFCYHVRANFITNNVANPLGLYASTLGVSSHFTFYDKYDIDTTISKQCGMRIKSIKSYSLVGSITSNKKINYYDGKLLNRFRPLTAYYANHEDIAGVSNGNGFEYIGFYKKITVSGNNFGTNGGNLIGYGKVEEIELSSGSANLGKKVFSYYNSMNKTAQDRPYIPNLRNGLILKEEIYHKSGNLLTEKTYSYQYLQPFPEPYICINVVPIASGSKIPCNLWYYPTPFTTQYYDSYQPYLGSQYGYNVYTINSEWSKLGQTTTKEYLNGDSLTTIQSFTYNSEGSLQSLTAINSKNDSLITKYYYPIDRKGNAYIENRMIFVHNTGTPEIIEKYKGTKFLSRQRTWYYFVPNSPAIVPQYIYMQYGASPEEKRVTIDSYDDKGNITQYTEENNTPVAIVWNTDKTLPVAKVVNATYSSLVALGLNSDFRSSLPNALVTTFTYTPLVGIASQTDPKGITTYYNYDSFMHLAQVLDNNLNILKEYNYHFSNQPIYYNVASSQVFYKQNCSAGASPGAYAYSVAANKYSSEVSQADADSKAQNEIKTNGQNAANTNGSCYYLNLGTSLLNFVTAGGTQSLGYNSNASCTSKCSASWIYVPSPSGSFSGTGTLYINCGSNTGPARTGTVTIQSSVSSGNITKVITINQPASSSYITANPTNLYFNSIPGVAKTISVTSSPTWSVSSTTGGFITATKVNETTLSVGCTKNLTVDRTGTVTITNGSNQAVINVTQWSSSGPPQ